MERARFVRIALYAVAALGVFAAVLALLIVLKWQPAVTLGNWAVSLVLAKWRGAWIPITVCCAVIMELFFLNWEKTTMFRVFMRRGSSAVTDLGFALLSFSHVRWIADYVLSFGLAFAAVQLTDSVATRLGWMRWEMPADGLLQVAFAFAVYFLISTFVNYWQHRLQHSRWFWHLHRFHHSGTEYNIFTAFRINPAEMMTNLIVAVADDLPESAQRRPVCHFHPCSTGGRFDSAQRAAVDLRLVRPVGYRIAAQPSDSSFDR